MSSFGWTEAEALAKIRGPRKAPPRKVRAAPALKPDPYPWFTAAIVSTPERFEAPRREYQFAKHLGREFAFDYAWPDRLFAVEADGLAHLWRDRWKRDMEKFNFAALLEWRVLHFRPAEMRDMDGGRAARVVIEYLRHGGPVAAEQASILWTPRKD